MLAPNRLGRRAAPLISAADEEDVEPLPLLLSHVVRKFSFGEKWILDSELLGARKIDRPRIESLPVLLALEIGGHV